MKAVVLVALLGLLACGSASGATGRNAGSTPSTTISSTPSPSSAASPSATPLPSSAPSPSAALIPSPSPAAAGTPAPVAVTCTSQIPTGHELALVTLRNSTDIVVRDMSDISTPVTRCAFKTCSQYCQTFGPLFTRFVTATEISYIVNNGSGSAAMYLADLQTRTTKLIRAWSDDDGSYYWVFAWSPDGNTLSYLSPTAWRLWSAAGDLALSTLGTMPGYNFNVNSPDSETVGFSADGQYVALDQSLASQTNTAPHPSKFEVVRLSDHKMVYSRADGIMATWAAKGARLYFRTSSGVEAWDPASGVQVVAPGLAWINPWPSADGKRIAYSTADAKGNHFAAYLRLTDQPATQVQLSALPRAGAGFLTSTLVWYAGEQVCGPTVQCGYNETNLDGPPPTGLTYIHDLATGTVSTSIIAAFIDSWPHFNAA